MAMSRIWQQRISRTQGALTKFGKPAVLILAALAGLNMLWQLLFATAPDLTEPSRAVVNRSAVVGAFAQDFVAVWLEANTQDAASLSQFISRSRVLDAAFHSGSRHQHAHDRGRVTGGPCRSGVRRRGVFRGRRGDPAAL